MTSQIYFRFPVCWRHLFKEVKIYLQIKFWLDILLLSLLKTNGSHIRIQLPVSTLTVSSSSAFHSASGYQFSPDSDQEARQSYVVMSIFQDGDHSRRKSTSGFRFGDFIHLRRSTSICKPNFDDTPPNTAGIIYYFSFPKTNVRHI